MKLHDSISRSFGGVPMNSEQRFYYEMGRADVLAEQARSLLIPEPPTTIWERIDNFIKSIGK